MKSLVPWVCLIVASASQQVWADNEFHAYRVGDYNQATESLASMSGKDPVADYYLGRLYLYGYGHLKNTSLAMRYFTKAAEKGYLPAVLVMAKYSLFQEKNPAQAVKWFTQAAKMGDVDAQMFVAAAYLYGVGVKPNTDLATKYYIEAAKKGNSIAQFTLAEHFIDSRHSANNKLGLIWLNKSAASGNIKAMTKLGTLYINGKLVTKDLVKGEELLNKAASQNYAPAMLELGEAALGNGDPKQAILWFNKAADLKDPLAYSHLAHAYLQEKSPIYDPQVGFMWTLKAAQADVSSAKRDLVNLYQKGIGVTANPDLAKQWAEKAAQDAKTKNNIPAMEQAALWLSNGATVKLDQTAYQLNGIFSAWKNPVVLKNNNYNQEPKLELISQQALFKPQFELTLPNDVPINKYYDALVGKSRQIPANQWSYPIYPLNSHIEALEKANSFIVVQNNLPAPSLDANYPLAEDPNASLLDIWTQGWEKQVNYMSVFNELYFKALLGEAQSQFEIGQMFQYGLGVEQSDSSAIIFYQNAAEQQHLGAEYHLGLLYLQQPKEPGDYQVALNWLTDSAFKGNGKAQYALARLLNQGIKGQDGKEIIQSNKEQALSMLYLSAANDYGPAEYELAEHLARGYDSGLSVEVKKHRLALIRQLYQSAVDNGVMQALLPLAFYNAMEQDKEKQAQAFEIAQMQANAGYETAALLLGMLYDRGIGVSSDPDQAITWYQRSGQNPVSQFILGTYSTAGKGMELDKEKGIEQLKQSAQGNFSYADFNLSVIKQKAGEDFLPDLVKAYSMGNSHAGIVLADYYLAKQSDTEKMNQAMQIYVGLAEKGDSYAQLKLAYMMDKGLGLSRNITEAQRWYTAAAEQGNPTAQYLLGQFYQIGENGGPDYALAKEWYQKAANKLPQASVALGFIDETVDDNYADALKAYEQAAAQNDIYGVYNLALMYFYGKGVPLDYPKANILLTQAADHGVYQAMSLLALINFNSLGQPRDEQKGLSWLRKAAELGDSNALYELGLLSETGVAIKLDFSSAIKLYQQASDKGNEKAMLALARMYHYGLGVDKNLQESAKLYERLAKRQNAYAQYQLGTYYLEGIAGDLSIEKGRQLLQRASENGSPQARKTLERLNAETQGRVSFIEPVLVNKVPVVLGQSADLMYLNAMNEWNRGDEVLSRMILQRLVTLYPNFVPAKRAYEQINRAC